MKLENLLDKEISRRMFLAGLAMELFIGCSENKITNPRNRYDPDQNDQNTKERDDKFNIFDYFPLETGNEWIYAIKGIPSENNDIDRVLSVRDDVDKKVVVIGSGNVSLGSSAKMEYHHIYYIQNGSLLSYGSDYGDDHLYVEPPIVEGNLSMSVGSRFVTNFNFYNKINSDEWKHMGKGVSTFTLLSLEDIEVPVGRFENCLRIEGRKNYKFFDESIDRTPIVKTHWFAKGIGKVKTSLEILQDYYEFELIDYSV